MSVVLARRLRGFHALLDVALRERARPRPDDRTVEGIKEKTLVIKDRLAVFDARPMPSGSRQRPWGLVASPAADPSLHPQQRLAAQ